VQEDRAQHLNESIDGRGAKTLAVREERTLRVTLLPKLESRIQEQSSQSTRGGANWESPLSALETRNKAERAHEGAQRGPNNSTREAPAQVHSLCHLETGPLPSPPIPFSLLTLIVCKICRGNVSCSSTFTAAVPRNDQTGCPEEGGLERGMAFRPQSVEKRDNKGSSRAGSEEGHGGSETDQTGCPGQSRPRREERNKP